MIEFRWNNILLIHLFSLWWSSQQRSTRVRNNIYSTQLFDRCIPWTALKLLWLMTHMSFLYFQQKEFIMINISRHLLFNWAIMSDRWKITWERELSIMTSSRKITYERNKLCKSQMFLLRAFTFFAIVHFSNTSAAINTICDSLQQILCASVSDRVKCLIYSINPRNDFYDWYLGCHKKSTDAISSL